MDDFSIIILALAVFGWLWVYVLLPAGMARRRHRCAVIWVLISLIISPIIACLLLLVLGNAK